MFDVSVIVVCWNSKDIVRKCLESVITHKTKHKIETIVVDNGSTDGLLEMVKQDFPMVTLIENGMNLGFSKAYNIGIRRATGAYYCIINSDILLLNDCIDILFDYIETHPAIGIVSPRLLQPSMDLNETCRYFPTLWNNFVMAVGLNKLFPRSVFFSGEGMLHFDHAQTRPIQVIAGAFWFVRRKAADEVGLLDERFFFYSEDADWCKRFWDNGWQIVFNADAEAIHYHKASSSIQPLKFYIQRHYAILQYWYKHRGLFGRYCITMILILHQSIRYLYWVMISIVNPARRNESREKGLLPGRCAQWLLRTLFVHPNKLSAMEQE